MTESETAQVTELRLHEKDTGSAAVQVALLTGRINHLSTHLQANRKDFGSRRGLLMMVNNRRRLLDYLRRESPDLYKKTVQTLGLRK